MCHSLIYERAKQGAHTALDAFEHSDDPTISVAMIDDDETEPVFEYEVMTWPGIRALLKSI